MKVNAKKYILMLFCMTLLLACQDEYYIDSGVHKGKYEGTTWDFLGTRPELFDSLKRILTISGLDGLVKANENVTFFAPTNQSILRTFHAMNRQLSLLGRDTAYSLDQVDAEVWRKYLSRYIFEDKKLLANYPQLDTVNLEAFPGQGYVSYGGEDMNIGVLYNDVVTKVNGVDQRIQYAGYRQLYLNYPFVISGIGDLSSFFLPFRTAAVATSDIQTYSGALHVLQFQTHAFGFVSSLFIQDATAKGIKPIN